MMTTRIVSTRFLLRHKAHKPCVRAYCYHFAEFSRFGASVEDCCAAVRCVFVFPELSSLGVARKGKSKLEAAGLY